MKTIELLKIIKACESSGVLSLEFDGLRLAFKTGDAGNHLVDAEPIIPPSEDELKVEGKRADEESERLRLEDELQSLQIDDPSRFEDLLVQRELMFSEEADHD